MRPKPMTYVMLVIVMIAMAMLDNVRGVFVPSFKSTFALTNTGIGMMFLISSLCYMLSSYVSGYVLRRTKQKTLLLIGAGITMGGVVLLTLAFNSVVFFVSMILMNIGIAAMGLAINTAIPLMKVANQAVLMNSIHFLYGLGATVTQKTTGVLMNQGMDFRQIYWIAFALFAAMAAVTVFAPVPHESVHTSEKVSFSKGELKLLFVLALALGLYVAGELQTGNWMISYLKGTFGFNEGTAANVTATFFLLFSLGRLLGGFVVARIGYIKAVYSTMVIAGVLYVMGLFAGSWGAWLIAISGIFFSVVYPTTMLVISQLFTRGRSQATGIVITLSSGVNMLMGLLIGTIADIVNIQLAVFVMPACLFISAALMFYISKNSNRLLARGDV